LAARGSAWRRSGPTELSEDIEIKLYNEAGQLVIRYKVYRCWVSECLALPDLEADSNAVLLQSITLEHEGWERDTSVQEPKEPSST
jgi:phage tail-like protein